MSQPGRRYWTPLLALADEKVSAGGGLVKVVKAADYEALQQELATHQAHILKVEGMNKELAKERDEARAKIVGLNERIDKFNSYYVHVRELEALEAERDALAVENKQLQAKCASYASMIQNPPEALATAQEGLREALERIHCESMLTCDPPAYLDNIRDIAQQALAAGKGA